MTGSGPDPVEAGLIESLARPGGNVTGLSSLNTELNTKRLEILRDRVPKLSRVGVLRQAGIPQQQTPRCKSLGQRLRY
jgi:putative tryptophan/tyrosine transport system substrate-binding protein